MNTSALNAESTYRLEHVSNADLLAGTRRLVGRSNQLLADLLAHLAEVEARGIHRLRACSSLYTYCVYELRWSEDAAFRRARAARRNLPRRRAGADRRWCGVRCETETEYVDEEIYYPGAGEPLIRLAGLPSFDIPIVWEVRSIDGVLAAFRSVGAVDSEQVAGHERLAVSDATLRSALDDIALLALPLIPSLTSYGVADGTSIATIHSGFRAVRR